MFITLASRSYIKMHWLNCMVSRSKIRGWVGGKEQIEEKERKYYAKESRGDTER